MTVRRFPLAPRALGLLLVLPLGACASAPDRPAVQASIDPLVSAEPLPSTPRACPANPEQRIHLVPARRRCGTED